jgi:hypothetical protein
MGYFFLYDLRLQDFDFLGESVGFSASKLTPPLIK